MGHINLGQAVEAKAFTDATFAQVLAAPKSVAMFYSPNCPYSRKFLPIYQALAGPSAGVLFAMVNVDENVQNAGTYKVHMLPTVVFFVGGKEVGRIDGVQEQSDFTAEMAKAFSGGAAQAPAAAAAQASAEREGTTVATPSGPSTSAVVLASAVGLGILGAVGYAIFGK